MTTFRYQAARSDGARVNGTLEALTIPDAAALLSGRGLYPLALEPSRAPWTWRRPSARDQSAIFASLASLLDAGVSLQQALDLTERCADGRLHDAVVQASAAVRDGMSLAGAMERTEAFSSVAIGLIRAGERGTGLSTALEQATIHLEREADTVSRIRAALAYPLLLALVGTASISLIVVFIVPRFAALLADVGQTLPLATRLLLGVSTLIREYGFILSVALAVAGGAVVRAMQKRKLAWHDWLLRLPLIGRIRHAFAASRVARTLSVLLGAGTPALAALEIAREAAGDTAISQRLLEAKATVAAGNAVASALQEHQVLPYTAQRLAMIGDQSGRLSQLLAKAADFEDREAHRGLKVLVGLLEPVLILLFASLVAFVAAALLQAVYSLRPV